MIETNVTKLRLTVRQGAAHVKGFLENMKKSTRKRLSALLIIGMPVVVLLLGLRSGDLPASIMAMKQANPAFLLGGLLCPLGFLLGNALSIRSTLKCQGYRLRLKDALLVSITGEYYANVTPGASGGQPMQIYRMHKKGIPVGAATSATVVHFIAFQFMVTVLATALGILYWPYLQEHVGGHLVILIGGYSINAAAVVGVLLLAFYRTPVRVVMEWIVRVGTKLRFVKNPERLREKFMSSAETFHDNMLLMLSHKGEVLRQLLICGAQAVALLSVQYFVYRALGLSGTAYPVLLMMSLMEFVSAAYAPLPGASGARESVFSLYFDQIFPGGATCLAALMIWRFISYYFLLITGAIIITTHNALSSRRGEREDDAPEP